MEELVADKASFRSMSGMTAAQRDTALGSGAIALLLNTWFEERFEVPAPNIPNLSHEDDSEAAAESVRRYWGLGQSPIANMIHLLEAHGVRVFSLSIQAKEVDAFSLWRDAVPFTFLNTQKSAEHSRFDAAHELGHLILHRHGSPQGQQAEREANTFASALLMPRADVIARAPKFPTLSDLVALKRRWTVSVAALAYRLHTLRLISDWHYRQLAIQMAKRRYHRIEPQGAPRETSQVLAKIFASLRSEGVSKRDLAEELCLPPAEIDELVFGLTLTSIEGANRRSVTLPKTRLRPISEK